MSGGRACQCDERIEPVLPSPFGWNRPLRLWRVIQRHQNCSAFNGYHPTRSDWSCVTCLRCSAVWRTKAGYVDNLDDITQEELEAPGATTTSIDDRDVRGHHDRQMIAMGRAPYTREGS